MSQENVEFIRNLFSAGASMDKQALLAALPELIPQVADPESAARDAAGLTE